MAHAIFHGIRIRIRSRYADPLSVDRIDLDREVIKELREIASEADPGLVDRMVHLFLRDAPGCAARMRQALARRDSKNLGFEAHSLKSKCANLGAEPMARVLARIEKLAQVNDLAGATPLVEAVERDLPAVLAEVRSEGTPFWTRAVVALASASGLLIGSVVLVGWAFDIQVLKSIRPDWIAMRANTAVCFLLMGLAIGLLGRGAAGTKDRGSRWQERFGRGAAALAAFLGALDLLQHLTGWSLGIDELLFRQEQDAVGLGSLPPGRMAPNSSFNFLVLGSALLLLDARSTRARWPVQYLALSALLFTLPAVISYLYGASFLRGLAYYTQMAAHTAVAFLPLSLGVLFARPRRGFQSVLLETGAAGIVSRRILPAIIAVPFAIGWLILKGASVGWYGVEYGVALVMIATIAASAGLALWSAWFIQQREALRERAEKERIHSRGREIAALESARMKSELLADVSHDVRTPLNAMVGMAEALAETRLEPEQKRYIEILLRASDNLLALLNDLLDLSKPDAGRPDVSQQEFDLREILSQSLELVEARALRKGLKLSVSIEPDVPRTILSDPNRLKQILMNLLGNAVKFTESGSVHVRAISVPDAILFSVSDTGIGIPKEQLGRIFGRFSQASSEIGREFGGAGLGLSIARHWVERLGGRIWAESVPGSGSTFLFTISLLPAPARSAAPALPGTVGPEPERRPRTATPAVATAASLRVLVVDDSEENRMVVQTHLESLGHGVECADNGKEAVEKYLSGRHDLILMDLRMPVMDGEAAAREIRRIEAETKRPRVPIIMLSATSLSGQRERSLEVGCDAYLSKPVRKIDLVETISRLVGAPGDQTDRVA